MPTVEHVVRALRREILAALADETPLPSGVSLIAERATVSLSVHFVPSDSADEPDRFIVAATSTPALHHITLEFHIASSPPSESAPLPVVHRQPALQTRERVPDQSVLTALSEVFGAPGFDSSARATVFREAFEELDEQQRLGVLLSLGDPPTPGEENALTQARHRIQRLASSGPAGREHGLALLRHLGGTQSTASLIQLVAERWRTPSEWAAESTSVT